MINTYTPFCNCFSLTTDFNYFLHFRENWNSKSNKAQRVVFLSLPFKLSINNQILSKLSAFFSFPRVGQTACLSFLVSAAEKKRATAIQYFSSFSFLLSSNSIGVKSPVFRDNLNSLLFPLQSADDICTSAHFTPARRILRCHSSFLHPPSTPSFYFFLLIFLLLLFFTNQCHLFSPIYFSSG